MYDMNIDTIVTALAEEQMELTATDRCALAIKLSMWLRFSANERRWHLGCLWGLICLARSHQKNVTLSEISPELRKHILAGVSIDDLVAALQIKDLPEFVRRVGDEADVDDLDYAANVVKYLVEVSDRKKNAKLERAYHVLSVDPPADQAAPRSWATFHEDWKTYRNAAPLLYACRLQPELELLVSPEWPGFGRHMENVASHPAELKKLLGIGLWLGRELIDALPVKATRNIHLPQIPSSLIPARAPIKLEQNYPALSGYVSGRRTVDEDLS